MPGMKSFQLIRREFADSVIDHKRPEVGDGIYIISIGCKANYNGRKGVITSIDEMGHLHGTWGSLALLPGEDKFILIKE
jgi:hypothetical protein